MSRKKLPHFENVEILDLGAEGKAIARINDTVTFIRMVAPGDIVDVQITRKRKNYMEGRVTRFREYSEMRVVPFCEHFEICGGCKWQHIPYPAQLKFKQKQVQEALKRMAKIDIPPVNSIIGSDRDTFYRNKLEFTFSTHRWLTDNEIQNSGEDLDRKALGFHIPGLFDRIVDIRKCWLQDSPSNEVRDLVRVFTSSDEYPYFSQKEHSGFLRNLIIRTASTGENMVLLSFFHEDRKKREELLDHILSRFPGLTSLMYVINEKKNDTLYDQDIKVYHGKDHITEQLEDLIFRIGPKSFFQTNTGQALKLYQKTREFAGLSGDENVYDLYTGTGSIAIFLARHCKKVIGIESVPEAIEDAKRNAEINKINNARFFTGDMRDMLTTAFMNENGKPDVIVTDPPRAGMHPKVIERLLEAEARRIVYVSCNPYTQARDLELLGSKYRLTEVQPVDMFPHTHHVENIAQLDLIQ